MLTLNCYRLIFRGDKCVEGIAAVVSFIDEGAVNKLIILSVGFEEEEKKKKKLSKK
jgi:hypothetical protein